MKSSSATRRYVYRPSDFIFVDLPVCDCGEWKRWKITKTVWLADGRRQYATCLACGRKKKIVALLPCGGNQ